MGVRTAVAADADQLAALFAVVQERHHREHPQLLKAPDLDASMSQFFVLLAQPDVTILVPEVGGRPAGYSYVELLTRPETAFNHRALAPLRPPPGRGDTSSRRRRWPCPA